MHRAASQLRRVAGIYQDAWNVARRISRGMVEKARAEELHLERSFYGRLSGQAA